MGDALVKELCSFVCALIHQCFVFDLLALFRFMVQLLNCQEWGSHPEFGREFCELMDKIVEEFCPEPAGSDQQKKRKPGDPDDAMIPVLKKPRKPVKVDANIVKVEDIGTDPVLLEFHLSNVKNPAGVTVEILHSAAEKTIWVVNKGNVDQKFPQGFILAGFGKGSYKQRQPEAKRELLYKDLTYLPEVLFNSTLKPVQDVVNSKRLKQPSAKVCYHSLVDAPTSENPGLWKLTRSLDITFVPEPVKQEVKTEDGEGSKGKQAECAALFPATLWQKNVCSVIWTVNWATTGLMPVRPQVVVTSAFNPPPQSAVKM